MTVPAGQGIGRSLLLVTLATAGPMLGGAALGMVVDASAGTSPLFLLIGFGAGNLLAVVAVWLLVRAYRRRSPGATQRELGDDGNPP